MPFWLPVGYSGEFGCLIGEQEVEGLAVGVSLGATSAWEWKAFVGLASVEAQHSLFPEKIQFQETFLQALLRANRP